MEVKEYSDENFANSLLNNHTSASQVREKKHLKYFTGYLKDGLNAQTIVIERNYISKDFISDYASYYSTCYVPYDKTCTRLHFFSLSFNEDEFRNAITLKDSPIWESYLGYIVIPELRGEVLGKNLGIIEKQMHYFKNFNEFHKNTNN